MGPITILLIILLVVAALIFMWGIIAAGIYSLKNTPESMPSFLTQATTIIGGILATNLGAVLGLSFAQSNVLRTTASQSVHAQVGDYLQIGAAYLYVGCLIMAFGFWAVNKFRPESNKIVSIIPEFAKTLLGVIAGASAVALGVTQR